MGYNLSPKEVDILFATLSKEYKIFAPKRFKKQGRYSATDIIKYAEISTFDEMETSEKSTYSAKEIITPIVQTLYYFSEDGFTEAKDMYPDKKILIFVRPCDINAQKRQDKIFLDNGYEDTFYKRIREKVRFVCIECVEGFDTCFCVSMDANKTDDYSLAVRICEDGLLFNIKDDDFIKYFKGMKEEPFTLKFIEENILKVNVPKIPNVEVLNKIKESDMWDIYNTRCISCGSCTTSCPTCTCFSTRDVTYGDNPRLGERRRVAASCHIKGFDEMAGGHIFRKDTSSRMRYKVLHKVHDYKAKFKTNNMCIGCGRCNDNCPMSIMFSTTVNKLSDLVQEITGGDKCE